MNFNGKWICDPRFSGLMPLNLYHKEHEPIEMPVHPPELKNVHMLVRKTFVMPAFRPCTLRIAADDYYKLYINGRFVAKGAANGYHFQYYYNELDVSAFLHEGENTIAVEVYYPGLVNRVWNSGDLRQGMVADLISDGEILLRTDGTWKYTNSRAYTSQETIGYQTQFVEDYDSNLEETNWRECGFDDTEWDACAVRETDYTFCDKPVPVVSVYPLKPVIIKKSEDGRLFYDFGHELVGMLRITAREKRETGFGFCAEKNFLRRLWCAIKCVVIATMRNTGRWVRVHAVWNNMIIKPSVMSVWSQTRVLKYFLLVLTYAIIPLTTMPVHSNARILSYSRCLSFAKTG